MAERRVALGKWMPDLPTLESPGLRKALNAVPRAIGYGPFGSLTEIGDFGALDAYVRGSIQVTDSSGIPNLFAGNGTKLYRIQSAAWANISRGGNYSLASTARWEFAAYSSNAAGIQPLIIGTCLTENQQVYQIGASTLFADLAAAAPKARHNGVISSHYIVGYTNDAVDGTVPNRIWWPALGNASSWPVPGTTAAISAQSDFAALYGDYGDVTGIIGGATWGTIFQERCIRRADYVGGDIMFDITRPESARGLAVPGLAVPIGPFVLYYSNDGWYVFDGSSSTPVGKDVVDDWFGRELQFDFRHRVSTLVDPDLPVVHIGFPGIGSVGGQPNKILHYNWLRKAFAYSEVLHDYLCLVVNARPDLSIDRSPSPIPDMLTGSWGDVQTATCVSGGFLPTHRLASFTGSALPARFETGDFELAPGRRSITRAARPIVTSGVPSVSVAKMGTRADAVNYGTPSALGGSGRCDLRADGRYHSFALDIASGWTGDAIALDVDSVPTGNR